MLLLENGTRFETLIKTITGKQFRGLVVDAQILRDREGVCDYFLRVPRRSVAKAGDVITFAGSKFILGTAQSEMSWAAPLFRFLRMMPVMSELAWSREITITDLVTELERDNGKQALGTAYAYVMSNGTIQDAFHVQGSKFRLITPSAVQLNDHLDDLVVTFIEQRYGVNFCEVR